MDEKALARAKKKAKEARLQRLKGKGKGKDKGKVKGTNVVGNGKDWRRGRPAHKCLHAAADT